MYSSCKVCGRAITKKGYSTIGNQKVCSMKCAADVVAEDNDRCGNCGSPVWEDDYYAVQGTYCCCPKCRDALKKGQNEPLRGPASAKTQPKNISTKPKKAVKKAISSKTKGKNQFEIDPGMQVGGTNIAVGPRDWDTNDIDFGPGDSNIEGNYYHGDKSYGQSNDYNNYGNSDYQKQYNNYGNYDENDDDEDDAYGDINDQNYLNQYGDHQIIQKNESLAAEQMKGNKIPDSANKPKNQSHSVIHHGDDIKCSYCGFVIKDGAHCLVDNYGKKFDTDECFSNYFQGIPRPKIG